MSRTAVTGDTITNKQIRRLRDSVMDGSPLTEDADFALAVDRSLGLDSLDECDDDEREAIIATSRERVADAYNARTGGAP